MRDTAEEQMEFDAGQTAGFARQAAPAPSVSDHDDEAMTTIASEWHSRNCTTCGHTFRLDDRVHIGPEAGRVRHADSGLDCAGPAMAPERLAELTEFAEGVLDSWPVAPGVPLSRTDDHPHLLQPPQGAFQRHACLFCGHSFRPLETVIVCPCQPQQPICRRAVHRDPVQGLVCWESWRPGNKIKVCPVTLRRLDP